MAAPPPYSGISLQVADAAGQRAGLGDRGDTADHDVGGGDEHPDLVQLGGAVHGPDARLDRPVAAGGVEVVLDARQTQGLARRREDGGAPGEQVAHVGAGRPSVVQDLDGKALRGQGRRRPAECILAGWLGKPLVRHGAGSRGAGRH